MVKIIGMVLENVGTWWIQSSYLADRPKMAKQLIKTYNLNNKIKDFSDVGSGQGFLLYEIKKILPNIEISGIR